MKNRFHPRLFSVARRAVPFPLLALFLLGAQFARPVFAAAPGEIPTIEPSQPTEPGSQHAAISRTGVLTPRDGLTLRLTTDLGSVNIVQVEAGSPPGVRYTVHIETDARGPA